MKGLFSLLITLIITLSAIAQSSSPTSNEASTRDTLIYFPARPASGFNFGYYLFLPKGIRQGEIHYLMVETTNGGVSDSISFHEQNARIIASKSGVANYTSKKLRIPLLVPVFPRSQTDWTIYTHALDRDAMLIKRNPIERLDLQLISMIEDAGQHLKKLGHPIHPKFFMSGFSASGTFANRMSLLHPDRIKAIAAGGINSIAILPVSELKGKTLNYPLGIADFQVITGKPVQMDAFRFLPQLLYMGALDENDAAAFTDGYSPEESKLVYELMGKKLIPERWSAMETIYRENNVKAEFRTYPGIGHGTDLKMLNDLADFFSQHSNTP